MLRSATSRLIAAQFALVALSAGLVLGLFAYRTVDILEGEAEGALTAQVAALEEQYAAGGLLGLAQAIERRLLAGEDAWVYLLTDRYGRPLTGNLGAWPPTVAPEQGPRELKLYRTDRAEAARVSAIAFRLPGGERLLVARDAGARAEIGAALGEASLWALGLALVLSLVAGWLLSRVVARRLGEVRRTAQEIMSGDLARRIPLHGTADAFDRLNATLNAMLDRIEALVDTLRTVTDSLAHDLRSPLTRLRARMGELTDPDIDPAAREEIGARATAETAALIRLFEALTEISRAEAGVGRDGFEPVDLAELARDAVELYEPAAAEQEIALCLGGASAPVRGHPQLLARALSNLLDNALRYAPAGSAVTVVTGLDGKAAVISVRDRGPGIPAEKRAHVLGRFATLDPARGEGSGLGLALVAAVARLHGARLDLDDAGPGLEVRLEIPRASGPAGDGGGRGWD